MHSADKLLILMRYLPAFATACKRAGSWYFADAFAGYGHCDFGAFRVRGSTLIALEADPPFAKVVSVERSAGAARALRQRTAPHGNRSHVVQGDCNDVLVPSLKDQVDPDAPLLVLFDQTGFQLRWETVAETSAFRAGPRKTELLIFVNTPQAVRFATTQGPRGTIDASFPPGSRWREHIRRLDDPGERRDAVADAYCEGLKEILKYRTAFSRSIGPTQEHTDEGDRYHLVFATDEPAGERIMLDCFEKGYLGGLQQTLFE